MMRRPRCRPCIHWAHSPQEREEGGGRVGERERGGRERERERERALERGRGHFVSTRAHQQPSKGSWVSLGVYIKVRWNGRKKFLSRMTHPAVRYQCRVALAHSTITHISAHSRNPRERSLGVLLLSLIVTSWDDLECGVVTQLGWACILDNKIYIVPHFVMSFHNPCLPKPELLWTELSTLFEIHCLVLRAALYYCIRNIGLRQSVSETPAHNLE